MASVGKAYLHALGPSKQLIGDIESRFLILLAANIPFFLSLSTFLCVQCCLKLSFFFFFFTKSISKFNLSQLAFKTLEK